MSFSTQGPDCYADGTTVLDGEYYALVAQTAKAGDVSFTHDGRVANTNVARLLRALPRADKGRCPETTFAVNADELPFGKNTTYLRLYLLDTRIYQGGVAQVGGCGCVQASVPVTAAMTPANVAASGLTDASGFVKTALSEDAVSPVITGMRFEGDEVVLTVRKTMPRVNYVAGHASVNCASGHASVKARRLGACKGAKPVTRLGDKDEIELRVPRGEGGSAFFQVYRQ